jgi:hypothetical protein
MRLLAYISVFLFGFGFWICKLMFPRAFYPQVDIRFSQVSLNNFTDWRYGIYSIAFWCIFLSFFRYTKDFNLKIAMFAGIGFSGADIIDRYISNITTFQKSDYILIPIVIITTWIYQRKQRKILCENI